MINIEWRECTKCHKFKEWKDFRFVKLGKNWRSGSCRDCEKKPFTIKRPRAYTSTRDLKTDNWEAVKPTDYELSWMKEADDLNRPHPVLYTKIQ